MPDSHGFQFLGDRVECAYCGTGGARWDWPIERRQHHHQAESEAQTGSVERRGRCKRRRHQAERDREKREMRRQQEHERWRYQRSKMSAVERGEHPILRSRVGQGEREFQRECKYGPPWHAFWPSTTRQKLCPDCRQLGRR